MPLVRTIVDVPSTPHVCRICPRRSVERGAGIGASYDLTPHLSYVGVCVLLSRSSTMCAVLPRHIAVLPDIANEIGSLMMKVVCSPSSLCRSIVPP